MKPYRPLIIRNFKSPPQPLHFTQNGKFTPNVKRVFDSGPLASKFPLTSLTLIIKSSRSEVPLPSATQSSSPVVTSDMNKLESLEENIEKAIYQFRFMALLGVFGSLIGSFLCFIKEVNQWHPGYHPVHLR